MMAFTWLNGNLRAEGRSEAKLGAPNNKPIPWATPGNGFRSRSSGGDQLRTTFGTRSTTWHLAMQQLTGQTRTAAKCTAACK